MGDRQFEVVQTRDPGNLATNCVSHVTCAVGRIYYVSRFVLLYVPASRECRLEGR